MPGIYCCYGPLGNQEVHFVLQSPAAHEGFKQRSCSQPVYRLQQESFIEIFETLCFSGEAVSALVEKLSTSGKDPNGN
jgi:hypothetical protein